MHWFLSLFDLLLQMDVYLAQAVQHFGAWVYAVVGSIVFVETGFVIAPFLPGDSLIFAAGTFVARGLLRGPVLFPLLVLAACLGDTVNYLAGHWCRGWLERDEDIRWIKKDDLRRAQEFYAKHGAKMIVLARFIPVIRTFAPFIAGVTRMRYLVFFAYNVLGACLWVGLFLTAGFVFGNIPVVRERFTLIVSGMAFLTTVPLIIEAIERRRADKRVRT